jgi:subtilase family serine protease
VAPRHADNLPPGLVIAGQEGHYAILRPFTVSASKSIYACDDEDAFASTQSLLDLRHAFTSAAAAGITVLGSSGDGGTANSSFTPVKNPTTFPFPTVEWPASDPLVTGVGGTYLCTDPVTGTSVDVTDPPANCQNQTNREVGWIASGGGFSHVFARPAYQDALPTGSTPIGTMRGVPDVAYQASSRTGVLVYDTAPGDAQSGLGCREPVQLGLVRRRRHVVELPAMGRHGRDRRPDRRVRAGAD